MRKTSVTDDELGEVAYETYCKAVGGKSFNGDALPSWAGMKEAAKTDSKKENIVMAWKRAGRAVCSLVEKKLPAPIPVAAESMDDPSKIAPFPVTGVPSGRVSSATPNLSSLPTTSMPAPIRNLTVRTKCCGSRTLSLKTGGYACPCGDHTEPL
jgi:hypothetical protein